MRANPQKEGERQRERENHPHTQTIQTESITVQLFPRLEIRRFSCSLAELFLAPTHICSALSVESRSVAAVVSTSRLPSHFPLGWIATCVVLFTHRGGASGECGLTLSEGFL